MLGDLKEAIILLAFATMSIVITVVQETRTERVLEALRDLTSPRALVIRDGERRRIAGREVVRGDLVVLAEGDRVPADAVLLQLQDLQTDESLLTGESVPVRKIARGDRAAHSTAAAGRRRPAVCVFRLAGRARHGIGEVIATGVKSEIGKIGQSLGTLETEPPRLQAQTRRARAGVRRWSAARSACWRCCSTALMRGGWLDAVLAGIALGMSMLPEEFPVVLTVFMAMGAWRISRARVLTRRAAAIETLGSATVLCTDKTGTLTENRMSIVELRLEGWERLPTRRTPTRNAGAVSRLWPSSACSPARRSRSTRWRRRSMISARAAADRDRASACRNGSSCTPMGFGPDLLAMTQSGKPDATARNSSSRPRARPKRSPAFASSSAADRAALTQSVDAMAAAGLRVLGVARAAIRRAALAGHRRTNFAFEFLGLVGLADPLRPSVAEAVRECRSAGIKVVMITGDYPATARAIARQAGLERGDARDRRTNSRS